MLNRLIRRLVGDKPVAFGRRVVPAAAGPMLAPLAADVLAHYRNMPPPPGAEVQQEARAFTEQLLTDNDPADVVASLIISLPALAVLSPGDGMRRFQIENAYHSVTYYGLERLKRIPVQDWRLSDRQIAAALDSYARVMLANPHDALRSRAFLAGIMERAASGSQRAALVAFIDAALQSQQLGATQFRMLVDENLPALGIAPEEIPILAQWAAKGREIRLLRDRVIANAGPLLGPALAHLLDEGSDLYRARADQCAALRDLFGADASAKGVAFSCLLDLTVTSDGYDNLQAIARHQGYFSHELAPPSRPLPPLDRLAIEMIKGKLELADPDRDHARLIFLLTCNEHHTDDSRLILKPLLKTAQAYPGGQTAQALNRLIEHRGYTAWAADVREIARGGAEADLPPIHLPDFMLGNFGDLRNLETHFANLLEPRLYDEAHCNYLARVAKLHDAMAEVPAGDQHEREIIRLICASSLGLERHDRWYAAMYVDRGRILHELRNAFRPLVTSQPDAARKLASLAHQIESRSSPSAKWLRDARAVLDMLPEQAWLGHLRRVTGVARPYPYAACIGAPGEAHLRALIYLSGMLSPADVGPVLADYALRQCYATLKGVGIRSEKLGNACVWSLAELPAGAGVPYLARILARVKYPKVKLKIDARLNEVAQRAGMGRAELDEISVPTHGLDRDGTRRVAFEQGEAVFRLARNGATLDWYNESGKPLKSPSKAIKDEKELFKEVQADLKELNADLAIQPQRLQQFYLQSRSWPADTWRSRYLDHPLLRGFARKLVWWIDRPDGQSVAALPDDAGESMRDVAGNPIALEGATVRLWHPMDAEVADVEAWRDRLEALQVTQPFAQVWREVYALTDAERATATYTNRWAAHVLKQHQAMTLARLNGWHVTHRMCVDAPNDEPWHLVISAHGLAADYWVQGAGGDNPETSESGAYAYVSTDRVQFHRIPEGAAGPLRGAPVPLTEIPPVVYSEIMRHADLFTAVASIAADPNWLDRGRDAAHPSRWDRQAQDYWLQTNTAALVESGKRRRAMLERIVPRLKIAARLRLEDRNLVVRGSRHEYEIHLGSGACSRSGRHICIVPESFVEADRIWLPFEGDRTLSIIISKALLLAADDKITDPVILRQL
ncbi:MAG: DUF4132 domain-containing protein [Pseudomonadota bacterium]